MQTSTKFEKIPRGLMWSDSPIWQRYSAPRRPPCQLSRDVNSCDAQIEVGPESRLPRRSSGNTSMTPTFFVGHMSASLGNHESNSNCWFDAVTFKVEIGSKHCSPNGSALDRSGFCPSPKCRARDHVAAASNKQMSSNQPDRIRSKRLIKDRILCPPIVSLRMQCTTGKASSLAARSVADSNLPIPQHHREDWVKPAICGNNLHVASPYWKAARRNERQLRYVLKGEPSTGNRRTILPLCRLPLCRNLHSCGAACNSVSHKIRFGKGNRIQVSSRCACGEP